MADDRIVNDKVLLLASARQLLPSAQARHRGRMYRLISLYLSTPTSCERNFACKIYIMAFGILDDRHMEVVPGTV